MPTFKYVPSKGIVSGTGGGFEVNEVPIKRSTEALTVAASGTATLKAHGVSVLTTGGATGTITLPNGVNIGDQKLIVLSVDNGNATLSVTTHETSSPEVFTGGDAGDSLLLVWGGAQWYTVANSGWAT